MHDSSRLLSLLFTYQNLRVVHMLVKLWVFLKLTSKMCFLRHFLFKPGGTSPMYCTTSPGYPLTSSTVYSPPPRPLPRNTFSRPAFSLKKPYKHCNWKCAALSAILISVTLLLLLAYFIGESLSKLPARQDVYLYRNALSPIPYTNADTGC